MRLPHRPLPPCQDRLPLVGPDLQVHGPGIYRPVPAYGVEPHELATGVDHDRPFLPVAVAVHEDVGPVLRARRLLRWTAGAERSGRDRNRCTVPLLADRRERSSGSASPLAGVGTPPTPPERTVAAPPGLCSDGRAEQASAASPSSPVSTANPPKRSNWRRATAPVVLACPPRRHGPTWHVARVGHWSWEPVTPSLGEAAHDVWRENQAVFLRHRLPAAFTTRQVHRFAIRLLRSGA